jgi:hypothetical protein
MYKQLTQLTFPSFFAVKRYTDEALENFLLERERERERERGREREGERERGREREGEREKPLRVSVLSTQQAQIGLGPVFAIF